MTVIAIDCDSHAITTRVSVPLKAKHENEGVRQKALETGATKRGVQLEWGGVHTARLLAARQAIGDEASLMPYPTLIASARHSFARLMTAVGAWGAWAIRTRRLAVVESLLVEGERKA